MDHDKNKILARREIKLSLNLMHFSCAMFGIDFYDEDWSRTLYCYLRTKIVFSASAVAIVCLTLGEFGYIGSLTLNSPRLEDIVGLIHLNGYAWISLAKMITIWFKRDVFKKLLGELEDIWPVPPLDEEQKAIKEESLANLRIMHLWYFWINVTGVWSYILTPAVIHAYVALSGQEAELGSPWFLLYPFDKKAPVVRELTYALEGFMGLTAVWTMIGPDLLFTALASHIGMSLRLLNLRLRRIAPSPSPPRSTALAPQPPEDHFQQIVENIKLHQKLIRYRADIEDAFSFVFLMNIVLSSVNICCAGFNCVFLEPLLSLSNKMFLVSSLYQMGVLCWCGDDIYKLNSETADAVYAGGWYRCDTRCRKALQFLIHRTQKPLAFTAMKFKYINLVTYTSILTTSYSYFALLNTMYRETTIEGEKS